MDHHGRFSLVAKPPELHPFLPQGPGVYALQTDRFSEEVVCKSFSK